MPEKCAQLTLQLLNLVRAICASKPGQMEQIVDIPVPQIVEDIVEVIHLVPQERIQQYTVIFSCDLCRIFRELHSTRRRLVKHCKVLQVLSQDYTSTTLS